MTIDALQGGNLHLLADFDAVGVAAKVHFGLDTQTLPCGGGSNEFNDHPVADQRAAPPVAGDVADHAVPDLIPFAGYGREMAEGNAQALLIDPVPQALFHRRQRDPLLPPP